jgi:hypothetical protein
MIQFKRGTTNSWKKQKKPLAAGQPGYDKDKHKIKIGDGTKLWSELPYSSGLSGEEILSSETEARARRAAATILNPLAALLDSPAVITYGTDGPDKNTVGQVYLQYYDTEPETDYIIESGIKDGWIYKKWKSGLASCSKIFTVSTSVQTSLGNSGLYQNSSKINRIKYPFTFVTNDNMEYPSETASIQSPGGLVWLAAAKGTNSSTQSASYCIISPDRLTDNVKYQISIKVDGFWK